MQLRYLVIRRYDVLILSQKVFFDFAIISVVVLLRICDQVWENRPSPRIN